MTAEKNASATGNKLNSLLSPITLITALIGIILAAVEALTRFAEVFEVHFYLALSLCYAATSILLLRMHGQRKSPPIKRFLFAIWSLSTIAYFLTVGFTFWEHHVRKTGHADRPSLFMPPDISLSRDRVLTPEINIRFGGLIGISALPNAHV